jgi:hypothetical protein
LETEFKNPQQLGPFNSHFLIFIWIHRQKAGSIYSSTKWGFTKSLLVGHTFHTVVEIAIKIKLILGVYGFILKPNLAHWQRPDWCLLADHGVWTQDLFVIPCTPRCLNPRPFVIPGYIRVCTREPSLLRYVANAFTQSKTT